MQARFPLWSLCSTTDPQAEGRADETRHAGHGPSDVPDTIEAEGECRLTTSRQCREFWWLGLQDSDCHSAEDLLTVAHAAHISYACDRQELHSIYVSYLSSPFSLQDMQGVCAISRAFWETVQNRDGTYSRKSPTRLQIIERAANTINLLNLSYAERWIQQ